MANVDTRNSPFWTGVVAILALLCGFWQVSSELPFTRHGISAQARVTGFRVSSSRRSTSYYSKFEFIAPLKGTACTAESSSWFWTRPKVDDTVAVLYYVNARGTILCEADSFQDRWIAPLLFIAVGVGFLVGALRKRPTQDAPP
jgi:hypothetical protein